MPPTNEAFKKAFLAWEAQAAEQWTALLRNPEFLRAMWESMEQQFRQQQQLTDALQAQLARLQLPTAADNQALLDEIGAARGQIDQLRRQLDGLHRLLGERDP